MKYQGDFECFEDVVGGFACSQGQLDFIDDILFANYENECYEGYAFVIFRGKDGILYEVNGSHCSCYGLEDQWEPEPIVLKELKNRAEYNIILQNYKVADFLDKLS